jgi:hypothetical protein
MLTIYFFYHIKKHFLHEDYLDMLKPFKTKKVLKFSLFFFTVYRVHAAVGGWNFAPIGEYLSFLKHGENERRLNVNN